MDFESPVLLILTFANTFQLTGIWKQAFIELCVADVKKQDAEYCLVWVFCFDTSLLIGKQNFLLLVELNKQLQEFFWVATILYTDILFKHLYIIWMTVNKYMNKYKEIYYL